MAQQMQTQVRLKSEGLPRRASEPLESIINIIWQRSGYAGRSIGTYLVWILGLCLALLVLAGICTMTVQDIARNLNSI